MISSPNDAWVVAAHMHAKFWLEDLTQKPCLLSYCVLTLQAITLNMRKYLAP